MKHTAFFIYLILCFNLYSEVIELLENDKYIYYNSLYKKNDNSFILNNFTREHYFNNDIAELFHSPIDEKKKYRNITYSKDIKNIKGIDGGNAILLPNIKSFIKIDNDEYDFSENNNLNSFTIEFYLNPYEIRMNSKVFSKFSIYNDGSGSKYSGIRANIINGRLVWQLSNIFMYEGKYSNVTLSKGEFLKENEWRHHSISFDAKTGKLVKYIDGLEEEVIYLTSTGDSKGSPYLLDIKNTLYVPIYLGQGFIGGIDDFHFEPNFKKNFDLYRYNDSGEIISSIIDLKNNDAFIDEISYKAIEKNATYIDVYYRYSNNYFVPNNDIIEWNKIDNTNEILTNVKARYIQIKAILKSNIDRNITPILENIYISYHNGRKPFSPVNFTAESIDNGIVLKWAKTHENITGYKIYYGTRSGIYNDASTTPIVIGNQNEYVITGLDSNKTYYLRITSIGGESGNIESDFSDEVYARPNN